MIKLLTEIDAILWALFLTFVKEFNFGKVYKEYVFKSHYFKQKLFDYCNYFSTLKHKWRVKCLTK